MLNAKGDHLSYEGNPELAIVPFPPDLEWINAPAPLTIQDLRGKIVILDFWTYGCINCIHMIPILRALEEKYPNELVVIGIHSAKFTNEGETENIRRIVQRYNITHPIINDHQFIIWQTYGIQAWPTLVVVDPRGNVLAAQSGEIPLEPLDALIAAMVDYWDEIGELDRTPLAYSSKADNQTARLLNFPGKVTVDGANNRLFIADTNNNRIIIADLTTYAVLDIIGSGIYGYADGTFEHTQFRQPQGMTLHDNILYIADTNNHTIRAADLKQRTVVTIAGTGEMGSGVLPFGMNIREPRAFQLRSPWDVEMGDDDTLYIAHAGSHQIFAMNLSTRMLSPVVGNGREALVNNQLATSELAQPSGLYFMANVLYFADSESSTIRAADFHNNVVLTIAGTLQNNLFDFGDVDGAVGTSRLQHPLGVTGSPDGTIYVADTYNHKIKAVDSTMTTHTLLGLSGGGYTDGGQDTAQFNEPGGLDYHNGQLYVADTNNHVIRVIDLMTKTVKTITFPNPERLQIANKLTVIDNNMETIITLPTQTLAAGDIYITLRLILPEGHKLNPNAPSYAEFDCELAQRISMPITDTEMRITVAFTNGEGRLYGEFNIYYCEATNESLCFIDRFRLDTPIIVTDTGERNLIISRDLPLAKQG